MASSFFLSLLFFSASSMSSATRAHSSSLNPRVVIAGVPKRMPEGSIGLRVSSAMTFLLSVMPTLSSSILRFLPGDAERAEHVGEYQVIARAAGEHAHAVFEKDFLHRLGILEYLRRIGLERRLQRFAERDRLCGDIVHVRAALEAGEDRFVYLSSPISSLSRVRIMPPRGPRSVLCVVEVMTSNP